MRLLYFIMNSGILIGLVLLIRKMFRKQIAPGMLYALWLIPLIRLLIPFSFFEMPVFGTAAQILSAPYAVVSEVENVLTHLTGELETLYMKEPDQKGLEEAVETESSGVVSDKNQVEMLENAGAKGAQGGVLEVNPGTFGSQTKEMNISQKPDSERWFALAVIWGCGSALLGIYAVISNRRLKRGILHMETIYTDCPLPVRVSDAVVSPCLFGLFRPCILMNRIVAEDPVLSHYVLEHELTHYRQKDHIWTFLRVFLRIIYWWNPLVWIGASCAAEDAELACDAQVIRGLSAADRKAYGYSLLRLLKSAQRGSQGMCVATSMSGSRKSLKRRMEGIAGAAKTKKQVLLPVCVLLIAAMLYGCGMPSTRSWIKAESMDELLSTVGRKAVYEYTFRDDLKSRLLYYEVYEQGELSARHTLAFGNIKEEECEGKFILTLQWRGENESGDAGYYAIFDWGGISDTIRLQVPNFSPDRHSGYLCGAGEKREIKVGDDLILMADYFLKEDAAPAANTCESLENLSEDEKKEALKDYYFTILVHMAVSDQDETDMEKNYEPMEYPQMKEEQRSGSAEAFVQSWADAFVDKDGRTLLSMMSEEVKQQMIEDMWLEVDEEEDFVYFGWSSPWPMFGEGEKYRILENDGQKAEILYYASDSTPHIYVWRETLEYEQKGEGFQVVSKSMEDLSSIHSAEDFYRAYPNGEITGTMMDYQANGLGAYLNDHALEEANDDYYSRFLDVKKSALELLNIAEWGNGVSQDISDKVSVSAEDMEGMTIVQITFLQDGSTVEVPMTKPYGDDGIWIPQTTGDTE